VSRAIARDTHALKLAGMHVLVAVVLGFFAVWYIE
jgi:hypothetical protein